MSQGYSIYLKRTVKPSKPALSIKQIKKFLNIDLDFTEQDDLLNDLLSMATEYAEWYTEKSLIEQTWQLVCIGYPPKRIYLPYRPLVEILKVTCQDLNGIVNYKYHTELIGSYIEFCYVPHYGKVEIEYLSGHTNSSDIPGSIQEGILHHIFSAYHYRDSVQFIPQIKRMYNQFRELKLAL